MFFKTSPFLTAASEGKGRQGRRGEPRGWLAGCRGHPPAWFSGARSLLPAPGTGGLARLGQGQWGACDAYAGAGEPSRARGEEGKEASCFCPVPAVSHPGPGPDVPSLYGACPGGTGTGLGRGRHLLSTGPGCPGSSPSPSSAGKRRQSPRSGEPAWKSALLPGVLFPPPGESLAPDCPPPGRGFLPSLVLSSPSLRKTWGRPIPPPYGARGQDRALGQRLVSRPSLRQSPIPAGPCPAPLKASLPGRRASVPGRSCRGAPRLLPASLPALGRAALSFAAVSQPPAALYSPRLPFSLY